MKLTLLPFLLAIALSGNAQPKLPPVSNQFVVIAHRGDHTKAPENTLQAFEAAIAAGADYVEVDLRTTNDGHLIVYHDATLGRMTNGAGNVKALTLAEVRQLSVSDKQHPEYGVSEIPTFFDVLLLCKDRINVYLDFKDADAGKTWKMIQAAGMQNSVVVYVNSEAQYHNWREVAPAIPLMVSLPSAVRDAKRLRNYLQKVDADILDGSYAQYTPDMVKTAEELGRVIWADIQQPSETPMLWESALETGLHGLQTDHPADLIAYLEQQHLR